MTSDEDNWRNDYPDEEESPHSCDSEGGGYWNRYGVAGMIKHYFSVQLMEENGLPDQYGLSYPAFWYT